MTLPDIIINYRKRTAHNRLSGATCQIIEADGVWYTNAAGLIALEKGVLEAHNLHAMLGMAKKRQSVRFLKLLKPTDFNGLALYSILGWVEYRKGLVDKPKENT